MRSSCAVELDLVYFVINLVFLLMAHPEIKTVLSQFCLLAPCGAEDLIRRCAFLYRIWSSLDCGIPSSALEIFFVLITFSLFFAKLRVAVPFIAQVALSCSPVVVDIGDLPTKKL